MSSRYCSILKGLAVVLNERDEAILSISKKGSGVVTAADIQEDHDVDIINPDHVIANLNSNGELNMRLTVRKGRGYSPADSRLKKDDETRSVGKLLLDASYSPVVRVSYSVENARVEQRTDLDKLIIDLETNGTIEPEEAIGAPPQFFNTSLVYLLTYRARLLLNLRKKKAKLTQSYFGQSMTWSLRFVPLIASKLRTSITSVT